MRAIGYTRVSTDEQAQEGVSLAAQREKITAYAGLYGLEIVAWIEDAGQSGKTLERPGLQEALTLLRKGDAEALVVAKLDRLSRSVVDWNRLVADYFCEKKGKQLLSVADQIDTRTASGRLVLNVLMSVSQWEREAIGERTRDALRHKQTKGERVGGVPFGYDLAEDGKTLLANPAEQRALALILGLRTEGYSLQAIADELNRQGIPTKKGRGKWLHTAVNRIVSRAA